MDEEQKKTPKLDAIKGITNIIVGVGVGTIIGNVVGATTNPEVNKLQKYCIKAGTFVIGSMISDVTSRYVNSRIDDSVEKFNEEKTKLADAIKAAKEEIKKQEEENN